MRRMRRHSLHRAFAALLAVWFAVVTAEPAALHQCPMHDQALAPAAVANATPADHGGYASHVHVTAGQTKPAHDGGQEPSGGHACTCMGQCSATVAVTVPDAEPLAWLAGIVDIEPRLGSAPVRF